MRLFSEESFEQLGYYVYCLIDPRNNQTFYVGMGKGNRVFDHIKEERNFVESIDNEISRKLQKIREIHQSGLEVRHVIHRYGMTKEEAFEVESALIDAYKEVHVLCNKQSGHDAQRGRIDTDDLIDELNAVLYNDDDVNFDYIIIKTHKKTIDDCNGSLYEASRKAWSLKLDNVKNIKYVLATVCGVVKEVYETEHWYPSKEEGKVEFDGHVAPDNIRNQVIGKRIPEEYRKQGNAAGALYKKPQQSYTDDSNILDTDELNYTLDATTYHDDDIDFNYIIIKTHERTIDDCNGSLYEASRKAWSLNIDKVKKIKYVLATVNGIVKEVYEVDNWDNCKEKGQKDKVEFDGHVAPDNIRNQVIDKRIPAEYRKKGNASSSLYKKQS